MHFLYLAQEIKPWDSEIILPGWIRNGLVIYHGIFLGEICDRPRGFFHNKKWIVMEFELSGLGISMGIDSWG